MQVKRTFCSNLTPCNSHYVGANLVLAGVLVVLLVVPVSVLVVLEVVVLLRLLMFLVLFFAVRLAIC